MAATESEFDAIIVAGGTSTRFGSDKLAALIDGTSVLEHVRDAVTGAATISIIGPEIQGGPVPAIAAGLTAGTSPIVVVVAGDRHLAGGIAPLLAVVPDDGVALMLRDGRQQYLTAAWNRTALTNAMKRLGALSGQPVRALLADVPVVEVVDLEGWSRDIDTPTDLPT